MQMLQITPMMGYIAAHAEGMTIGPNILILPPLNPMHVAEEAATLDVLTGGNYILGLGLGYRQPEFDAVRIPLAERAPRFNEAIGLMRRLWTEDRVEHQGRFYTVKDAGLSVKPVRPGGPPLYIAGQADVSVRRAARIGDAWLMVNTSGLKTITPLMQTYRAAIKEYGRTPLEYPITVECYVGERHATAHEECREPLEYKYQAYAAWGMEDLRTGSSFEDFVRDRFIIKGDKVSVKEEIARYRELLGADSPSSRCQWPGLPQEQALGSIRRLGEIFRVVKAAKSLRGAAKQSPADELTRPEIASSLCSSRNDAVARLRHRGVGKATVAGGGETRDKMSQIKTGGACPCRRRERESRLRQSCTPHGRGCRDRYCRPHHLRRVRAGFRTYPPQRSRPASIGCRQRATSGTPRPVVVARRVFRCV